MISGDAADKHLAQVALALGLLGNGVSPPANSDTFQTTRMFFSNFWWTLLLGRGIRAATPDLPSTISIIHVNDIHSHIDEFNSFGTDCTPKSTCGGGYARIKAMVDTLQAENPDNLLLNAGDEFQGTMFYTYYRGEKTAQVLNLLDFDAVTIGNHEFDDGPEHLATYLRNLTVPIVCANINTSITDLSRELIPYTIIEKYGVGIIGVITPETSSVSSPGDDVHFIEPVDVMQDLIDDLHAQGIHRIIALTHIGYGADIQLVQQTRGISLVVGGHSHTFLGNMPGAEGPYPTMVQDLAGFDVPIVTNGKWGFNLGHLRVTFDQHGRVASSSGQPIALSGAPQDAKFEAAIRAWKTPFMDFAAEVVGYARKSFAQVTCQITECSIGNLIADAMLASHRRADVALMNAGGIRAGLVKGNITRGQVLTVLPFGSTLVDVMFTGRELWDILEGIVSWRNIETHHDITSFAQIAGARIVFSSARPQGSRMISISILRDAQWQDLQFDATYVICTLDFMVGGGDFWWPEKKGYTQTEKVDDVLVEYFKRHKSLVPVLDGRIQDSSLKGRVKAHAEVILSGTQKVVELWFACFGTLETGHGILQRLLFNLLDFFEGGQFR